MQAKDSLATIPLTVLSQPVPVRPLRMKFRSRIAAGLLGAWLGVGAQAQQVEGPIPMRDMLTRYLGMLEGQCTASSASIDKTRKSGDEITTRWLESFHQMFCECHPAKARHLLKTLSPTELSKLSRTKEEFNQVAVPGIMEPCHGELARRHFDGDSCLGFVTTDMKPGTAAKAYCGCMRTEMVAFTDHDITTYLREITETMPALRAAKAAGKPLPSKSALLTRYVGALDKCGGGQEFFAVPR